MVIQAGGGDDAPLGADGDPERDNKIKRATAFTALPLQLGLVALVSSEYGLQSRSQGSPQSTKGAQRAGGRGRGQDARS